MDTSELDGHPGANPLIHVKQEAFCLLFYPHFGGKDKESRINAAINAGYSKTKAERQSRALLLNQKIRNRLEYLQRRRLIELQLGSEEALAEVAMVARADYAQIVRGFSQKLIKVGETKEGEPIYDLKYVMEYHPLDQMNTAIIKRMYIDKNGQPVVELHDKVAALDKVLRVHKLLSTAPTKEDNDLPVAKITAETEQGLRLLSQAQEKSVQKSNT